MQTVEFRTNINNRIITIPIEYKEKFKSNVKVILLQEENIIAENQDNEEFSLFGALSDVADPSLWEKENMV